MAVSPSPADMPRAVRPVFISYARLDQPQVSRAVEFLRGGGLQVFVDSQSISYGSDWRVALVEAIEKAERIMLFWTAAAAASRWVTREWQLALKRGKKVVPTLLDDTPLPPVLARLQAVTTLRGLFPAPVRRPEELIEEPGPFNDPDEDWAAQEQDIPRASGLPPERAADPVGGPAERTLSAPSPSRSSFRPALIVGSLAVAGVLTWFLWARPASVGHMPVSESYPSATPASGVIDVGSNAPPVPASAAVIRPPASVAPPLPPAPKPAPSPPVPPEPAFDEALIDSPFPILAVLLLALVFSGWFVVRARLRPDRARAIVRELYAA